MNQTQNTQLTDVSEDALHGISCPNCGGIVPIPEGQTIVQCPYCELRSLVRGERGLRRYQVPLRVRREDAKKALVGFFNSTMAIARNVKQKSTLTEAFVVYLPFWVVWAKVLGWVFGQERKRSGKQTRYVPREIKIAEDMTWNRAAGDVGEFGVEQLPLAEQKMEPYDYDELHAAGLVFEPVGSVSDAQAAAQNDFEARVKKMGNLSRVSQTIVRQLRRRMGVVYYPLWVMRYHYRKRAFQVVVDGYTGKVLYGKAPGNTVYRAAMLVGGAALGAFLFVDAAAIAFYIGFLADGDDTAGFLVGGVFLMGLGIAAMRAAYKKFRYGEHYEFYAHQKSKRRFKRFTERGVTRVREE